MDPNLPCPFKYYDKYILTDDPDVSWEDLERQRYLPTYETWIPFEEV